MYGSRLNPGHQLRQEILNSVGECFGAAFPEKVFVSGETPVPVPERMFDADELLHLVDASVDFWHTAGRYAGRFESKSACSTGVRHAVICPSSSSSNLLLLSTLTTSAKLREKPLQTGDEVITVAAGLPTTVNPIIQNRLVPVVVDIDLGIYNMAVRSPEKARSPRVRVIILAHTLGSPFNIDAVSQTAEDHSLRVIEDNCDALGSRYKVQLTSTLLAWQWMS